MTADFNKILDDTFEKLMNTSIAKDGGSISVPSKPTAESKVDQCDESIIKGCDEGLTSEAIEAIMDVLISKDVLLEPLKSLDKSYDEWAIKSLSAETAERQLAIESQRRHIKDIIKIFDDSDTLDSNVKKDIFEKMQAIQELGMPPEEVASQISDGADETLFPGNCSIM